MEDTGSANGISLNGERLLDLKRPLRSGDIVRIGRTDLVYLDGFETPTRRLALLQPPAGDPPVNLLSHPRTNATPPPGRPAGQPLAPDNPDASALTATQLAPKCRGCSVTALLLSGLRVGCVPWGGGIEGVVVNLSDGARAGR
jgi:FHA domain-containing protein